MWFNYKLPRPCKRGAYQFAHELDVPVISCFVKMTDTNITDNNEFNIVKYDVFINKVIYPEKMKALKVTHVKWLKLIMKQEKSIRRCL